MSILTVTYNPEEDSLREYLESIRSQTYRDLEVIIVDNGSAGSVLSRLVHEGRDQPTNVIPVHLKRLGGNTGFAHAMNLAIADARGALCLLLNPDAKLDPHAVAMLVASAEANPDILAFAPKVKLATHPDFIDSVGVEFSWSGDAAQRGLGQLDLGQFDRVELVKGVSMGAALIRRVAFQGDHVGPLDERFFMFFEDVDWSLRGSLYGYRFLTSPAAVVFHTGSESVRKRHFRWRYRLVERNVYYTAIKNFEARHLVGFMLRRTVNHLRRVVSGTRTLTTLRLLGESTVALCTMLPERRVVQSRRRHRDAELTQAAPRLQAIDPVLWTPIYTWETLRDSLGGLYLATGEERWASAYRYLDLIVQFQLQLDAAEVLKRLSQVAAPLPEVICAYAAGIGNSRLGRPSSPETI